MDATASIPDDGGMNTSPNERNTVLEISHPVDLRDIQGSMTEFIGYGGIKVITNHVSYGKVPVETVLDGSATAIEVTATQDGRGFVSEWATEDSDDTVYVERYSARGREFHGFIDRQSRKIVQAG